MKQRKPKFLVDFDGVWTQVHGQAQAVNEARDVGMARITGWSLGEIRSCMEEAREELALHRAEHGWRINGRITAFSDEDPFLTHNSLCAAVAILAEKGSPHCRRLYDALAEKGHADTGELGSKLFLEGSAAYLKEAGHSLLPEAVSSLEALLGVADVVFCSNFTTNAIADTWKRHGFTEGVTKWGGRLTLRGNAQKQVLTGDSQEEWNGRRVAVDRGHYLAILNEERPDFVVGDVFSLDLALPLKLRKTDPQFENLICLLRRCDHTPNWSLEMAQGGQVPGLFTIDSPSELKEYGQRFKS